MTKAEADAMSRELRQKALEKARRLGEEYNNGNEDAYDQLAQINYKAYNLGYGYTKNGKFFVYDRGDNMTINDLLNITRMSQTELAERFDIPRRTVQNWAEGTRTPPAYVIKLLRLALLDY